jgi:hypothetical protein
MVQSFTQRFAMPLSTHNTTANMCKTHHSRTNLQVNAVIICKVALPCAISTVALHALVHAAPSSSLSSSQPITR